MTYRSSSSSRSMISSVKPAASRSSLEVVPRFSSGTTAIRRAVRALRRGAAGAEQRSGVGDVLPLQRDRAERGDEQQRPPRPPRARVRSSSAAATACARRGAGAHGARRLGARIARFHRVAAARQLEPHALLGALAGVVLGEALAQPQRLDADERIGLRVEVCRPAEDVDRDRITLELIRLRRRASCRRRSAGSPTLGPRARSTGCAGCARAPRDFRRGGLRAVARGVV